MMRSLYGSIFGDKEKKSSINGDPDGELHIPEEPRIKSTSKLLSKYFEENPDCEEINLNKILANMAGRLDDFAINIESVIGWLNKNSDSKASKSWVQLPASATSGSLAAYIFPHNIKKINLSNSSLTYKVVETLINFLIKDNSIIELDLSNSNLPEDALPIIRDMLKINKSLEKINIEKNKFSKYKVVEHLFDISSYSKVEIHVDYDGESIHIGQNKELLPKIEEYVEDSPIVNRNSPVLDPRDVERNAMINNTFSLISESDSRIVEMMTNNTAKELLIIWGPTEAGKTTLALMLSKMMQENKVELEVYKGEALGDLKIRDVYSSDEKPKIGTKYCSETKFPNKFEANGNVTIFDCPGISDSDGAEHEIANMFFISKIFDTKKPCKFIVTVPYSAITSSRQKDLISTLNHFVKMFEIGGDVASLSNIVRLKDSIALVVTHVDANIEAVNIESVFAGMLQDNKNISPRVKYILENLKGHIHLSHKPTELCKIKEPEIKITDFDNLTAIPNLEGRVAIGGEYKNLPNELVDQVYKNIAKINLVIKDFFKKNVHTLSNLNIHLPLDIEVFSKNYSFIKTCLPQSNWYHAKLEKLVKPLHFAALQEGEELQNILNNNYNYLPANLKTLVDVLGIIEKFCNNEGLKKQIKDYAHVLQQQVGCLPFLHKLINTNPYQNNIHGQNPLNETVIYIKKKATEIFKPLIKFIKLKDNQGIDYYKEALFWLGQDESIPPNSEVTRLKAQAHSKIAWIHNEEEDYENAMKNYSAALGYNPELTKIYIEIGDLLSNLDLHSQAIKYYKVAKQGLKIKECLKHIKDKSTYEAYREIADHYAETGIVDKALLYYGFAESFGLTNSGKLEEISQRKLEVTTKFKAFHEKCKKEKATKKFYDYSFVKDKDLKQDTDLVGIKIQVAVLKAIKKEEIGKEDDDKGYESLQEDGEGFEPVNENVILADDVLPDPSLLGEDLQDANLG